MRGEWLWLLTAMFVVLALCVALSLLIWRLWRKITLPEGAPPPRWTDLSALKTRVVQTPLVLRLIATAALALLMSAPVNMIQDLVSARTDSYREVVRELSHSWGGRQLLIGPILSVPYTIKYVVTEEAPLTASEKAELALRGEPLRAAKTISREIATEKTAIVLPEELNIAGVLDPETRKRNIYSLLVYTADLKLSGFFRKPDFKSLDDRTSAVHWDRARLLVSLTDTKAFRGISQLSLGGRAYKFVPGTGKSPAAPTGFSAEVDLDGAADVPFSFNMAIGGSQGFYVAPVAVVSRMDLSSSWPHPKFSGMGLPISREAGPTGFTAGWNVPNLVRNYPQLAALEALSPDGAAKKGQEYGYDEYESRPAAGDLPLAEYVVGVDLFEPVFHYSLITRAVKYAMMFIGLTFLSVLVFEAAGRKSGAGLHLAQYGVIGLGLSLFYLALLAAAEHMPFVFAYILAAALNVVMIGGYVRAAVKRGGEAALVAAILTALYAVLFFVLNMEEYALIAGTALLVAAMAALMYATRNLSSERRRL